MVKFVIMSPFSFFVMLVLLLKKCKGGVEDNLIENVVEFPLCDSMLNEIPSRQRESPVPLKRSDIQGTWVSRSCETRPGFIHVTRSYEFKASGKMRLILHLYADAFCSKPKLSVAAEGHFAIRRSSLTTPGATEAEYFVERISLVSQSHKGFFELTEELNRTSCPSSILDSIRQYEAAILYQSPYSVNDIDDAGSLSCVPTLFHTWNELQLARVEMEPKSYWRGSSCRRKELYLGDLHSNPKMQHEYRPTAYQMPLLNSDCIEGCNACSILKASTLETPPILIGHSRARVPSLLQGSWASRRCEVQRHGLFLTRKLTFKPSRPRWSIRQRYFYDPNCRNATYTISASGAYKKVPSVHLPQIYGDAFDMTVRRMSVIPDDKNFAAQLNRLPGRICGISGLWRVNKGQDLTKSGGCKPIGLKVPTKEPEIFRMDLEDGEMHLTLGLTPTWPHRGVGPAPRPTAWGPPLSKCSPTPEQNNLIPVVGARVAFAEGGGDTSIITPMVLLLTILPCFSLLN